MTRDELLRSLPANLAAVLGLTLVAVGVGLLSVAWSLIVVGVILLALSLWGYHRANP